jgi:hypothetical protein
VGKSNAARARAAVRVVMGLLLVVGIALNGVSSGRTAGVAAAPATALGAGSRIPWQGKSWYLHGANVPWYNWSCDFGCGANGGVSSSAVRTALAGGFGQLQASGGHVARWWTFEGDPWQITRTSSGTPSGLHPTVYADFDAALELAETYDLSYVFVLFSSPSSVPSAWLTDPAQRAALASVLGQLFARYRDHPRILAWELFNEADFDVWNSKIALAPLQATVSALASSVHANSSAYVTVSTGFADGTPMFQGLGLDFYQAHWYDYMANGTYCLRCNSYAHYQALWKLDAPLVVGEYYTATGTDALQRSEDFYAKGYAGAWPWSLFPSRTNDQMAIDLTALQSFSSRYPDLGPRTGISMPTPTRTPTASPTRSPTLTPIATATPRATATATATATPIGDTVPPTISRVRSSGVTASAATVSWITNEAADAQVEYGTTTALGSLTPLAPALVQSHTVQLSGLRAGTRYYYRVKSRDAAGNLTSSTSSSFTTKQDSKTSS